MPEESDLLMFTGTECTHCHEMKPFVEQLEKEAGVAVTSIEVWHNAANMKKLQELDGGKCGGIPFFYNKKTGAWICGSASYDDLKKWALGK